jgi:hypothetical protein
MSAAEVLPVQAPPALATWLREVDALTSTPEALSDTVRAMVRTVLLALAEDPASDLPTRRDIGRMLQAVTPEPPRPPEALPGDPRD